MRTVKRRMQPPRVNGDAHIWDGEREPVHWMEIARRGVRLDGPGGSATAGQHWGGPEGDACGRAARRSEEMCVGALLMSCIPRDHVDGMVLYLRDVTDLPLGVHPIGSYLTSAGWRLQEGVGGR